MGNSSGKEQHGSTGTTVDQTPPISPTSPPTSVSPISLLNSHTPSSPTSSDLDPSRDRTPSLTLSSPEGCPSQNGVGNENGVVHVSPIKDTPVSFFKRSSTSALPAQVELPTNCQGCNKVEAGLLQECMASLGLSTMDERSYTPADLLRCFLNETEQMKEDLRSLKDKIESERNDWLQFQTDLQVALVVADRLRAEAEEELGTLREARQDLERQLADAKQVQEEDGQRERQKTEIKESGLRPSQGKGTPRQQGATERLGSEKEKGKELNGEKEAGPAVKPSDGINILVNGTSQTSVTQTLKSVSKINPSREKLSSEDSLISSYKDKKGDKPSFISSGSALIDPPIKSKLKPQEDFSTLLRRHGGSKRNSMLRWCQNRTSGYQNIEITNFSSSWMDGLAFCAVYHSYLPSSIPFHTLRPENKRENLLLAFQTGESVGITATLTAEEMLRSEGPDWQRVLGYVENIYQHFEM